MFTQEALDKAKQQGQQTRQANRKRQLELINTSLDQLLSDQGGRALPGWAMAHIAKARKGRVASLIAAKCGDCCCWQKVEIERCELTGCPLWSQRPYRDHMVDNDATPDESQPTEVSAS
jgi:hypothetical protein